MQLAAKIMASADFSVFQDMDIEQAQMMYKVQQKENTEINIKVILSPPDVDIEKRLMELFKVIFAFTDPKKIHIQRAE